VATDQLPPNLPQHLVDAAFIATNGEAAWPPLLASEVTRWLGDRGYGVLGTELWVIKSDRKICSSPLGRSGLREVHGNTVDRQKDESWMSFAHRAAVETSTYLACFDAADVLEEGDLRFQIIWVTEPEFEQLDAR
jgi:hypothetical protein